MKSIFSNKTFRILLTALIILSALFCCGAMAEEVTIIDSGDCGAEGDNVTWVLDSAGTLTISGEGKMMDYTLSSKSPWLANDDVIQSILIKDGISVIGSYSFCFCSSVKSLTIPDSLTSINSHAFYECISLQNIYCQSLMQWLNISIADYYANPMLYGSKLYINHELLTSAVIPSRIKYIRDYAFYNCNSLVSVVIPDGISSIGYTAFTNCSSLTSIHLPDSVTSIESCSFSGCSSLSDIILSNNLLNIGSFAFEKCTSLPYISLPDRLITIGQNAFYKCSNLLFVSIPDSVSSIGIYAFEECSSLITVKLPSGISSIGDATFKKCSSLKSITIPESISLIGQNAFYSCNKLEKVCIRNNSLDRFTVDEDAFKYTSPTIYCYEYSAADLWAYGKGYKTVYLDEMNLDEAIELTLPADCFLAVGQDMEIAYQSFPVQSAENIIWTSSAPDIVSVKNGVATAHAVGTATITASSGSASDSMVITTYAPVDSFELPDGIYIISKTTAQVEVQNIQPAGATGVFSWSNSDSAIFTVDADGLITALRPGTATLAVTSDSGISRSCSVYVCQRVSAIEFDPAELCLTEGSTAQLNAKVTALPHSFSNRLVHFSSSNEDAAVVDGNGIVTGISSGSAIITAAANSGVTASCSVTVTKPVSPSASAWLLPADLTAIEDEAFLNLDMAEVVIPDGCERIGAWAFKGCSELSYIFIPDSVTEIDPSAFEGCEGLKIVCNAGSDAAAFAADEGIAWLEG